MESSSVSIRVQRCPQCSKAVQVVPQYVTWCQHCGWNVNPTTPALPQTPFEPLYAALSMRLSQQLFDTVQQHPAPRPPLTRSTFLALVSAITVHLLTLGFILGGIILVLWTWPNPWGIAFGILSVLVGWSGRPRIPMLPKGVRQLNRQQAPTLFHLVDQVSTTLGMQSIAHLLVNERFNASFSQVGWRRAPVLTLGLPLVMILDAQELVALISHEIAHGVNGDLTRSLVVGSAVQSVCQYYWLLLPPRRTVVQSTWGVSVGAGMTNFAGWAASNFMRLVALLPQAVLQILNHLLWHNAQRAEYYADRLATSVAGADGMRGLLAKLHCQATFDSVVQQAAVRGDVPDLFVALQERLAVLPAHERERIRRAELQAGGRLDSTHPPTAYRIAMLQMIDTLAGSVQLSTDARTKIDEELRFLRTPLQQRLIARYLDRLG